MRIILSRFMQWCCKWLYIVRCDQYRHCSCFIFSLTKQYWSTYCQWCYFQRETELSGFLKKAREYKFEKFWKRCRRINLLYVVLNSYWILTCLTVYSVIPDEETTLGNIDNKSHNKMSIFLFLIFSFTNMQCTFSAWQLR